MRHAQNQDVWTADLRALLPDGLRHQCRVYDVRGSVILVSCSNAASATRLRFIAPDLLTRLAVLDDFKTAREIRIKVNPET